MEVASNKKFYKWYWFWNIIKHGMFFQGVRNRLGQAGIDIMPYYWTLEGTENITSPEVKGGNSDFSISRFSVEDLDKAQLIITGPYYKNLSSFVKEGQVCVGIKENNNIVAFMFIKSDSYFFRGKTFLLGKQEAYLHSMYTFEAYRGRRIAPYLLYHCYEICKELGFTRVYSISEYFNKSSRRFKQKLKAKQVALYLSFVIFKRYKKTVLLKRYSCEAE